MHDDLHSFTGCVTVNFLYIEIRIWGYKVEYVVFAFAEPVFPSFVPSFHEDCIESILGGKVNVTFHVLGVGRMFAVRLSGSIIGLS